MSAAIERHRARVAEILGAPAKSTMKVTSSPLPSKGTVTVTDNPVYYGPSVNPATGAYVPPKAPMSDAEIDKLIDTAAAGGGSSAPVSTSAPWMQAMINDGAPVPPSSTAYTSPLEIRPWYPFPGAYPASKSDLFTAKNVAIAAGIGVGLGLVVLLARR